jgi:beta-phosphoglucomutase-like phosphatase (HAD superfamily)
VSGNDARNLKPAPDIYLAALAKAGVRAECSLAVEDSLSGCLAVHAAGMRCVGYTAGGENPQDLSGADWRVANMAEIINIVKSVKGAG